MLLNTIASNGTAKLAMVVTVLPLLTFLFLMFFGRVVNKYRGYFATSMMLICFIIALKIFFSTWGQPANFDHFTVDWFSLGEGKSFYFGIKIDSLAALMILIVTGVSFLVHLFSIEYLKGDRNFEKYFSYLGLFTFSMLGIVIVDNLLLLFIFWELVGVSSYLLIGFWYDKPSAAFASKKAFIVNRIGDAGFLLGILSLWTLFGTLNLTELNYLASDSGLKWYAMGFGVEQHWLLYLAGLGLICGTIGKSAQFPLQVWLPNAMEGPTPVSALIHAATMVAAGVYMLARIYGILHVDVKTVLAIIGTITAFMGGFSAMAQTDIKKVLAFSTISQLGYMVMGMGVGAYEASLFHLTTHAFFKACLFLCAGAVIHSMHGVQHHYEKEGVKFNIQDMRIMGGLRKKKPVTFVCFTIAALSLSGLPFFSGFMSKDAILVESMSWANGASTGLAWLIPLFGFLTALMTAFYMGRQLLMVFFGEFRLAMMHERLKDSFNHVKHTPWFMRIPIIILAIFSIGFAFSLNPFDGHHSWFMNGITAETVVQEEQLLVYDVFHTSGMIISIALALAGLGLAYVFFGPKTTKGLVAFKEKNFGPDKFITKLSLNNWYLDEIYDKSFVKANGVLAKASYWFDVHVVDRIVNLVGEVNVVFAQIVGWFDRAVVDGSVNLVAWSAGRIGGVTRSFTNGRVQSYVWLVGAVLLIVFLLIIVK